MTCEYEIEEIGEDNTEAIIAESVEVEQLDEDDIEQKYKDELDDTYGTVSFGDFSFEPSRVLEELDPIAYRVGLSNAEEELQEYETQYVCPVCSSHHDDEDEATYCCHEETITKYEVDGEVFDTEAEAEVRAEELNEDLED